MYQYITSSQLMKNQKAATALPAGASFAAAQQDNGAALFFSIGDDGVLYLIREQDNDATGWLLTDLSSELAVTAGFEAVEAHSFAISQNQGSGTLTLAVAVRPREGGDDQLYLLEDLSNATDAAWYSDPAARQWLARPFDATNPPTSIDMQVVYLSKNQALEATPVLVVGLATGDLGYLQNYTVSLNPQQTANLWTPFETAENYNEQLGEAVGLPVGASSDGIYGLYRLAGNVSLTFTPFQGIFGPPTVTKLTPPPGASSLAVDTVNDQNQTDLYVAADGQIVYFPANAQHSFDAGIPVICHQMIQGVIGLYLHSTEDTVVVWGLTRDGAVFYSSCRQGSQGDAAAWSIPAPILDHCSQIASMVDINSGANEIFAHIQGNLLIQLGQDPGTTMWQRRRILLPALDVDDVVEYVSYTTTITVRDENNLAVADLPLQMSAVGPVTLYIDGIYKTLNADEPIPVVTNGQGQITLVQETDNLSMTPYFLVQDDGDQLSLNPMLDLLAQSYGVQSVADLDAVTITDEFGNSKPLLPPGTSEDDKAAIVQAIQQLPEIQRSVPQDGSPMALPTAKRNLATPQRTWGLALIGGKIRYAEGDAAWSQIGRSRATVMADSGPILTTAGDFFQWVGGVVEDIVGFVFEVVDDAWKVIVTIADETFYFFVECIADIINTLMTLFNAIKVLFEELVQWLGFIFQWNDILRTKDVLKNFINQYLPYAESRMASAKADLAKIIDGIESRIDKWAGLESQTSSVTEVAANSPAVPDADSAQAGWSSYQMQTNYRGATVDADPNVTLPQELEELLQAMIEALEQEGEIFREAIDEIYNDIILQIKTISLGDAIQKLLAILTDAFLSSAENLLDLFIDILLIMMQSLSDVLNAEIDIPVLSWLYQRMAGAPLSLLDLFCLVAAFPTTIIYKVIHETTPFPDDDFTNAVINASSWAELQALYTPHGSPARVNPDSTDISPLNVLVDCFHLSAAAGGILFPILLGAKQLDEKSRVLSYLNGASFYLATLPNTLASLITTDQDNWYQITSNALYAATCMQKAVDMFAYRTGAMWEMWKIVSLAADFVLGLLSEAPAFAAYYNNLSFWGTVSFFSSLSWNVARAVSPIANVRREPVVFAGKGITIFVYAGLQGLMILDNGWDDAEQKGLPNAGSRAET